MIKACAISEPETQLEFPIVYDAVGLQIPSDLPIAKWQDAWEFFKESGQKYRWRVGDLIVHGIEHWPDAMKSIEFDAFQKDCAKLASEYPREFRHIGVPIQFYKEALMLSDLQERIEWLKKAANRRRLPGGYSYMSFREDIRRRNQLDLPEFKGLNHEPIYAWQNDALKVHAWLSGRPRSYWTETNRQQAIRELQPIVDLVEELKCL